MKSNLVNKKSWEFRPGSPEWPEQHPACQETRRRGWRQTSLLPYTFLTCLLVWLLAGCAPSSSALMFVPVTGPGSVSVDGVEPGAGVGPVAPAQPAVVEVREYALVEQSTDNPTHLSFQDRVPAAVAAQRSGWSFRKAGDGLAEYNLALEPFGFRLQNSTSAPFSGYTLYHYDVPIQNEIARLWPVSLRQASSSEGQDFMLPFVTLSGEKFVASSQGVQPWPGQASGATARASEPVAYAQTHDGRLSVYAGPSLLYDAPAPSGVDALAGKDARDVVTWTGFSGTDAGEQHWGLQLEKRAVIDGQDLNQAAGYDEVFGLQVIEDQPLYFFNRSGITHLHYGNKDLPYVYDQVIHNNTGELSVFNPGSTGRVVWFYALRDGLWYYVEVGVFD